MVVVFAIDSNVLNAVDSFCGSYSPSLCIIFLEEFGGNISLGSNVFVCYCFFEIVLDPFLMRVGDDFFAATYFKTILTIHHDDVRGEYYPRMFWSIIVHFYREFEYCCSSVIVPSKTCSVKQKILGEGLYIYCS